MTALPHMRFEQVIYLFSTNTVACTQIQKWKFFDFESFFARGNGTVK